MRTFYLFKIKKNIYEVTRRNSYNLYNVLESIYHLNKRELSYYFDYFKEIRDCFNKKVIDNKIYQVYKDNYTYSKVNNVHIINDYYSKERSKLMVKRNYLCLKSTNSVPEFLKAMKKNKNIFVCDFKNKDYFWLEELV